ncbi:exosortase-associated EpsI family protein [Planctomycetota bacterium]
MTATKGKTISALRQPAFLACVLVLGLGVIGMSAIERALGIYLTKEPLLLQQPLPELNPELLAPYRRVSTYTINDQDLLQSLGTSDYLQWVLEDPRRGETDPARQVLLFITYYRLPDKVPHVPEECYLGSGYQRLIADSVTFNIPHGEGPRTVPGRVLIFSRAGTHVWSAENRVPVIYLFRVNGEYTGNRDEARVALNKNLFGKASYFSKVELAFNRTPGSMDKAQALQAAQDLLAVLLPILEQQVWPAWPPGEGDSEQ